MRSPWRRRKSEQYCTHWKIPYARSIGGRDVGDEAFIRVLCVRMSGSRHNLTVSDVTVKCVGFDYNWSHN